LNTRAAPSDIILAVKCDMGPEFLRTSFTSGGVEVTVEYLDAMHLDQEQVKVEFMSSSFLNVCILFLVSSINASIFKFEVSCADCADDLFFVVVLLEVFLARKFQATILCLLISNDHSEVVDAIKHFPGLQVSVGVVYLLLPSLSGKIDWCGIKFSTSIEYDGRDEDMGHCHSCKDADLLQTMDGPCCRCMLRNSVVYVPRDRTYYNISGVHDLNTNGPLYSADKSVVDSKR
jgi:endoribonuclease Dicer